MSEFDKFEESNKNLSKYTIKSYKTQYNKLTKLLKKDISDMSEKEIIEAAKGLENINSTNAMLNIGIVFKKFYEQPYDELVLTRESNKQKVKEHVKAKNTEKEQLPSYDDLVRMLDDYDSNKDWRNFIILYLLIKFNVRNQDLNLTFVDLKKEMVDENTNYIWINRRGGEITYYRNKYKTEKTYGGKISHIESELFSKAVKQYRKIEKTNQLIPNEDNVGHYVDKATHNLGSGNVYKIMVDFYKGDLQKLKQMASSRGTSLETTAESYDTDNK
jgi:hypothetical protein